MQKDRTYRDTSIRKRELPFPVDPQIDNMCILKIEWQKTS
jgi:hypothetical protein